MQWSLAKHYDMFLKSTITGKATTRKTNNKEFFVYYVIHKKFFVIEPTQRAWRTSKSERPRP